MTTAHAAARWQAKHGEDWLRSYWESLKMHHRDVMLAAVAPFQPASVLEVGCNVGANLRRLREAYPDAELWGLDINREAIRYAEYMMQQDTLRGFTTLAEGDLVTTLPKWAERMPGRFDVVLTCYTLAYVGPDELPAVLAAIRLLARRGLVLMEPMTDGDSYLAPDGAQPDEWFHDYARHFPDCALDVSVISPFVDRMGECLAVNLEGA